MATRRHHLLPFYNPPQPPVITTTTLPGATANAAYTFTMAASAGAPPYSWQIVAGPAWLSIAQSSGVLSGTPGLLDEGVNDVTIRVVDSLNTFSNSVTYLLNVAAPPLVITTSTLPNAVVGQAYVSAALQATGGVPPYTWSMVSATPDTGGWLGITAAGVPNGTPTTAETETVVFKVTDSALVTATRTFSLLVSSGVQPLVIITTNPLPAATVGTVYSVTMQATGGVPPYTWHFVSATPNTGTWLTITSAGVLQGTPGTAENEALVIQVSDSATHSTQSSFSIQVQSGSVGLSGIIVHGQKTTLTGSGFGTRPNYNAGNYTWKGQKYLHYCWCDFTEVVPPVPTGNVNTDWLHWAQTMNGIMPEMYDINQVQRPPVSFAADGSGIVSGGPSFGGLYWQRNNNPTNLQRFGGLFISISGFDGTYGTYPGEYFSCKFNTSSGAAAEGDVKTFMRVFQLSAPGTGFEVESIPGYKNGSAWEWGQQNQPTGLLGSARALSHPSFVTNFVRMECVYDATGSMVNRINNVTMQWTNSSNPTPPPTHLQLLPIGTNWGVWSNGVTYNPGLPGGNCSFLLAAELPPIGTLPMNASYADIYWDFTAARVEVTDGTHTEPQILLDWADGQIDFLGNQGQLVNGPGTLNVYNSADTIIKTASVTIGSPLGLPLVQSGTTNFTYLGHFNGPADGTFQYGGGALGIGGNSPGVLGNLYACGIQNGTIDCAMGKMKIPSPTGAGGTYTGSETATTLVAGTTPIHTLNQAALSSSNYTSAAGSLEYNGKLYVTAQNSFGSQVRFLSVGTPSLTGFGTACTANADEGDIDHMFANGMNVLPAAWATQLGAPAYIYGGPGGGRGGSIISQLDCGYGFSTFDPASVVSGSPIAIKEYINYPHNIPAGGGQNPISALSGYSTATQANWTAAGLSGDNYTAVYDGPACGFIYPGSRSLVFVHAHAYGPEGNPHTDPCNLNASGSSATPVAPDTAAYWRLQISAYDMAAVVANKQASGGRTTPRPYNWWAFPSWQTIFGQGGTCPLNMDTGYNVQGFATYDYANNLLYVSMGWGGINGTVYVFKVNSL